ncbi:MAG: hypothetical protein IPH09_11710 [bacterium]|nr:hypothetical protein [bacterium]
MVTRSYEFREQAQDTIDSVQQRVEYVLQRTAGDPGSISLGFCSTAPMRLQITAPDGQILVDFDNDEAYLSTAFAFDQEGPYKIRVGYGTAPVTGSFVLGTGNYGSYPCR